MYISIFEDLFKSRINFPNLSPFFCAISFAVCQSSVQSNASNQLKGLKPVKMVLESQLKDLLNDSAVTDKSEFLKYFMFVPLDNEEGTKRLWDLWKESYFELTTKYRKLFTQALKVQLEYFIDQRINAYNTFEILRLDNSYTYVDDLIVELKCTNCDKYYPVIVNIIAYFEMVINEDYKNIDNKSCRLCNNGTFELTSELKKL
jgi:hypothetical protein